MVKKEICMVVLSSISSISIRVLALMLGFGYCAFDNGFIDFARHDKIPKNFINYQLLK